MLPPRWTSGLLAGVVLLTSGCLGDDAEDRPSQAASPTAPYRAPGGAPVLFDVSRATPLPDRGVYYLANTDERAFTMNQRTVVARALPSLRRVYEVRSSAGYDNRDLWLSPDQQDAILVGAGTVQRAGTQVTIDTVRLQPFDVLAGDREDPVTARIPKSPQAPDSTPTVRVAGVVGRTAVLDIGYQSDEYKVHSTAAVSLDSGRVAWRRPGAAPLTVQGDLTVVSTARLDAPSELEAVGPSGRTRWKALDGTAQVALVGTTARTLTVARTGPLAAEEVVTLRTARGRTVKATKGETSDVSCRQAGSSIGVCFGPGPTLSGWDLRRTKRLWSLPTRGRYAPFVSDVVGTTLYGLIRLERPVLLDARTGRDLATEPGAAPPAVTPYGGLQLQDGKVLYLPAAPWPPKDGSGESPSGSESSGEPSDEPSLAGSESATPDGGSVPSTTAP